MRAVVITGMGLVAPTGIGLGSFWASLLDGRSGLGQITRFDASTHACQIGGQVDDQGYEDMIDPRQMRTTTHVTRLALAAAELALRDARLPAEQYEAGMLGVCIGTALGGAREQQQQHGILLERGARRVNPFIASGTANHGAGVEVASAAGAQGALVTFSSGCPSSLQAIGHAAQLVARGELDACVAGGTESPLTPMTVAALCRTQELSTRNGHPQQASRPFDRDHDGIVLSEGSCLFLLESAQNAERRDVNAYAEVLACTTSCDADGMYSLDPSGEAGARGIHAALNRSGMAAGDIDYVCAHANSSPAFDRKETIVLKKAFGEFAVRVPVSSIKGVLGHALGASGAFQVAAGALAIHHRVIPPTHNLENPDPECDLDCVQGAARELPIRSALVTSYGYGGVNSYLVLRKPR